MLDIMLQGTVRFIEEEGWGIVTKSKKFIPLDDLLCELDNVIIDKLKEDTLNVGDQLMIYVKRN